MKYTVLVSSFLVRGQWRTVLAALVALFVAGCTVQFQMPQMQNLPDGGKVDVLPDTIPDEFAFGPRMYWSQIIGSDSTYSFAVTGANKTGRWLDSLRWLPTGPFVTINGDTLSTREYARNTSSSGGTMSSFSLAADSGTPETVTNAETVTTTGGYGISTSVAATNTTTIEVDTGKIVTLYALQDTATNIRAAFPAVDSTRLTQDSILVYYQDGAEVGRDTISGVGTGGGGGGTDDQTLTYNGSGSLTIEYGNTVDMSDLLDNTDAQTLSFSSHSLSISGGNSVDLSALERKDTLIQDSILVYFEGGVEIGRDTISGTGGGGGGGTSTLAGVSASSTTTPNSLYTMTSTIPVEFRRSGGSSLLYLDETNGRIGIGASTPPYILDINSTNSAVRFPNTTSLPVGANGLLTYSPDSASFIGYYNAQWNRLLDRNFDLTDFTSSLTENYIPIATSVGSLMNSALKIAGTRNYLFGGNAPSISGTDNIGIGHQSGNVLTTGNYNVYLGYQTGYTATTGSYNVTIGYRAGLGITTGSSNILVGIQAGYSIGSGVENNMFGSYAGQQATGSYNNYYGRQTGQINPSSENNIFGKDAGSRSTGGKNIYIGTQAGEGQVAPRNNSGTNNIFLGELTGRFNTSGSHSIAIGQYAGYNNKKGNYNMFLGYRSAYNIVDTISTGSYNIALGYLTGDNISGTASNNILIGKDIDLQSGTGSNQLSIGNAIFGTGITGTGTGVATGAKIGINTVNPTAQLHLPAGTATANTAPLKFTSGTNLTTPEAGAMEWDGTNLYITQTSGPTRKTIAYADTDDGSASDTTDGSGDITVSHALGSASISVTATTTGTTFYHVQVHTKTSTTFKIRFFDAAGSPVTSTAVTADWIAKLQ